MKKIFRLLIVSMVVVSNVSYGQWIVNDPVHTYQSALNTAQLVKAEITRLQQLKNQITQLKNLGDLKSWKGKSLQEINALKGYIGSLKTIYGDIGAQTGRLRQRLDQAKVAKMTFQEYMQLEQQLVKEGEDEAVRRHDDDIRGLKKTEADYADVQNWESQVGSGLTQMGSSQMMNQQLNKLISQNSEVLKVMIASRIEQREDSGKDQVKARAAALALRDTQPKRAAMQAQVHRKSIELLPKSPLQK